MTAAPKDNTVPTLCKTILKRFDKLKNTSGRILLIKVISDDVFVARGAASMLLVIILWNCLHLFCHRSDFLQFEAFSMLAEEAVSPWQVSTFPQNLLLSSPVITFVLVFPLLSLFFSPNRPLALTQFMHSSPLLTTHFCIHFNFSTISTLRILSFMSV